MNENITAKAASLHPVTPYLGYFGLSTEPFTRSSVGDFFYEGAGRGATLDEILYILIHGEGPEGIITVTGARGVGKTALCRTLMERLPHQIEAVYLDSSALSPGTFLSALAGELREGWETECYSTNRGHAADTDVFIEELRDLLVAKHASGRQVVLLVDEAQAASEETLKRLLTLHDSQFTQPKLLQVVLFGRAEFDSTLVLRQMYDFRQRIGHQFLLPPLDADNIEDYLMRRMHAAGYRGPPVFSPEAVQLLTQASHGLISGLDRLAAKSLQIAWKVSSRKVEAQHIRMAAEGSKIDMQPKQRNRGVRSVLLRSGKAVVVFSVVATTVATAVHSWQLTRPRPVNLVGKSAPLRQILGPDPFPESVLASPLPSISGPAATTDAAAEASASVQRAPGDSGAAPANTTSEKVNAVPMAEQPKQSASSQADAFREKQQRKREIYVAGVNLTEYSLLRQRVEAAAKTLTTHDPYSYTIQLYSTDNIHPGRMERFLSRAKKMVDLSSLYVHIINDYDHARFRVTYGVYATREEAKAAVAELPEKYQSEFEPELFTLSELI